MACPDQAPLLGFVSLFGAAIARSNSVVMVPSEKYPLLALQMYQVRLLYQLLFINSDPCVQIFETSDLPGGVVNILTGARDHVTKYLAEHQDVDALWYFGSAEGCKFVEHSSAVNVKRTWVDYGVCRDWLDARQGQGEEFLYRATQVKNVWLTMGDIFAN